MSNCRQKAHYFLKSVLRNEKTVTNNLFRPEFTKASKYIKILLTGGLITSSEESSKDFPLPFSEESCGVADETAPESPSLVAFFGLLIRNARNELIFDTFCTLQERENVKLHWRN